MRLNYFISEYKKNWVICTIGIVLHVLGVLILSINEGRTFNHTQALHDAMTEVVSFKDENYVQSQGKSEDYEGKLIHVNGELKVMEPIADPNYNILVQAVKLRKIVQMYQWHEDFTENQFAEGDETQRNYFYFKDWNEHVVDSRSFHSLGHQNPRELPMQSKLMINEKAFIGNFEIGDAAKELITVWTEVTSDTRPEDGYIKMHMGWYYHVEDLFEPLVGDVRVKFQFAGLEGSSYTIVGKLTNGKIQPYDSKLRKRIILLSKGELTTDEIFKEEHYAVKMKTWTVRLFGFVMIFFAVISTESLLRLVPIPSTSYFSLDASRHLKGYIRVAALITIANCVFRQSLHYLGLMGGGVDACPLTN